MQQVDLIIIGGGPGGYETAAEAAAKGLKTVLFERDKLGGTCLNRGCIPTKCLCASAKRLNDIRNASDLGVVTGEANVDFTAVKNRITEVTDTLREGIESILDGVEIINAEASLCEGPSVIADGKTYTAPRIIIATGSCPAKLPADNSGTSLNSDAVLALKELPKNMVIIGGGVIGLEFASVFNSFGCKVTVIEYCKEVLPGFDREIAKRLRSYLSRKGIEISTSSEVTAIKADGLVLYLQKGKEKTVKADCVVSAVGRRPVIPEGLEKAGIETDAKGFIITDSTFRTTAPGVYAIGDVNGRCMLAHAASAQGRVVLGSSVNLDIIPTVVFTDPECAMVGITSEAADESDREYISVKLPYGSNGKALAAGESEGIIKLIVDKESGYIAGCHCVGVHAADLVAEASVAMQAGTTAGSLAYSCVHAHPTLSELLASAAAKSQKQI